jgi:aldose 1-epimerase
MNVNPSGVEYEISHGDLRVAIVEVGGGLRTLRAGDLEVLDGFAADEMCHDARGQLLLPWPNRIAGGRYKFEGQEYQLPLTEPSLGNAIHGLARWQRWTVDHQSGDEVRMSLRLYPSPGYPFALDLSAGYALADDGLTVTLRATNIGSEGCPFGAGQHPYLRCGTPTVDDAELQVPGRSIYRYDERFIPVERVDVAGTALDFRTLRPIGSTAINMDYTDLDRGTDGRARVVMQAPDGSTSVEVWMDGAFKHVTVYTGETVQPPDRRRKGLAVEPMTCPPNAFVSGEDLVVLGVGESWEGVWGIRVLI